MIKRLLKKAAKTTKAKKAVPAKKTMTKKRTTRSKKVNQDEMNFMIQELAYNYFVERGHSHGDDMGDWSRAESEIKKKYKV